MSTQAIQSLLSKSAALTTVLARVKLISQLQKIFIATIPPELADTCRVTNMEGNTAVISAASGAAATRLKQLTPQILIKFKGNKKQEQKVTSIRVEVQPDLNEFAAVKPRAVARTPLSTEGLNSLLEQVSDSPLKEALRVIKRRRDRSR